MPAKKFNPSGGTNSLRPIIREPRSTVEVREAGAKYIAEHFHPEGPSAHPGALFTTEGAGVPLKGQLGGGTFNPVSNAKYAK